jgi:hypothetical protein
MRAKPGWRIVSASDEVVPMNRALFLAVAAGLIGFPLIAGAKPFPAGRCTTLDDGTDQPPPGWQATAPRPIAMELPRQSPNAAGALDSTFIVDLVFSIQADGTVSTPRTLCSNAADPAYLQALLKAARQWRFKPLTARDGGGVARVAYRIVVSARGTQTEEIPLGSHAT